MRVDVVNQIGAVIRQVRIAERDGKEAKVVVATLTFATTPDDLWSAITEPERLQRWFSPVSGDLRLGGRYQIEGNASGSVIALHRSSGVVANVWVATTTFANLTG